MFRRLFRKLRHKGKRDSAYPHINPKGNPKGVSAQMAAHDAGQQMQLALVTAATSSFLQRGIDKDRQLLTLAALGIGVLIALVNNIAAPYQFAFWAIGALGFLGCIKKLLSHGAMTRAMLLDTMAQKTFPPYMDGKIALADKRADRAFLAGVIFTLLLAASIIEHNFYRRYCTGEGRMTQQDETQKGTSWCSLSKPLKPEQSEKPSKPPFQPGGGPQIHDIDPAPRPAPDRETPHPGTTPKTDVPAIAPSEGE